MSHPPSLAPSLPPSLPPSPLQPGVAHLRNLHVPHRDPLLLLLYFGDTLSHFRYLPPACARPVCVPSPTSPCLKTICYPQPKPAIHRVDVLSKILFSLDYFTRVFLVHAVPCALVCPEDWARGLLPHKEPGRVRKTLAYVCQWINNVDLAAVLPFFNAFWC